MLLYWLWNTHIERYADYRFASTSVCNYARDDPILHFSVTWCVIGHRIIYCVCRYQSEITTAEEVCILAGFGARCTSPTPIQLHVRKGQNATSSANSNVSTRSAPERGNISFGSKRRRLQAEYAPGEVQTSGAVGTAQVGGRHEEEVLSWAQLDAEDSSLSTEVRLIFCATRTVLLLMTASSLVTTTLFALCSTVGLQLKHMCLRYGYSLDPRGTPQRSETRQFTA
jgi:hypothetical protein